MKAGKEQRVPLSRRALEVLEALPVGASNDIIFKAPRGGALSDEQLAELLAQLGESA